MNVELGGAKGNSYLGGEIKESASAKPWPKSCGFVENPEGKGVLDFRRRSHLFIRREFDGG